MLKILSKRFAKGSSDGAAEGELGEAGGAEEEAAGAGGEEALLVSSWVNVGFSCSSLFELESGLGKGWG